MRRTSRWLSVAMVLGLGLIARATDWATLAKQAQARYAKMQAEVGDMYIEQEMENATPHGSMKSQVKVFTKGEKLRVEMDMGLPRGAPAGMGSMQMVVIGDGKDYWLISPMVGTQKVPPAEGERYRGEWQWWDQLTTEAQVVGEEKVNGRNCYLVQGKPKEGFAFSKLRIDKETFLLVKGEGKSNGTAMSVVSSDFRPVRGQFHMPFRTEVYSDGKLVSTIRVTSVKVNAGVADELFDPKKVKAKGPGMEEMMKMMQRQPR
ncbi:MAG: outer membrane lipoprotein-sorting protein [Candidatus Oleimicrobiaceae bacterium]